MSRASRRSFATGISGVTITQVPEVRIVLSSLPLWRVPLPISKGTASEAAYIASGISLPGVRRVGSWRAPVERN